MSSDTVSYFCFAAAWLLCSAAGYVMVRRIVRKENGRWRKVDRILGLLLSIFCNPLLLVFCVQHYIVEHIDLNDDASW